MKTLFLALCCVVSSNLWAQASAPVAQPAAPTMRFDGCKDRAGNPVPALADTSLDSVAQLALQEGKTVILFNPQASPALLPESRLFVLAHECARQYLGFPATEARTAAQARQADCWAVGALRQAGMGDSKTLNAIEDDINLMGNWSQLPGPTRELKLASCVTPATRGDLKLDTGSSGDAKWNTCMQSCGSKLYSCGRGASCEANFNQCVAGCNK